MKKWKLETVKNDAKQFRLVFVLFQSHKLKETYIYSTSVLPSFGMTRCYELSIFLDNLISLQPVERCTYTVHALFCGTYLETIQNRVTLKAKYQKFHQTT